MRTVTSPLVVVTGMDPMGLRATKVLGLHQNTLLWRLGEAFRDWLEKAVAQ